MKHNRLANNRLHNYNPKARLRIECEPKRVGQEYGD